MTGTIRINPTRWNTVDDVYPIQTVQSQVDERLDWAVRQLVLPDTVRWIQLLVERAQNPKALTWVSRSAMLIQNHYLAIGHVHVGDL